MGVLALGLYVEGASDARFLPVLVQRTAKSIIDQYRRDIDVPEPVVVFIDKQRRREDCILSEAKYACKELIPIIPVQMVEAWMLADHDALRSSIGTKMSPEDLGLPARPALVERDANPKHTLNEVVRKADASHSRRHQKMNINRRYELLAQNVDLNVLDLVPSYKEFKRNLTKTLANLHFLPFNLSENIQ